MTDPLTAWLGFLASPAAPRTTLSPLELDGYLTGIIVAPDLIKPSDWILGLWGEDEPVFDDADQMQVALDAVRERYNALVAEIDDGLRQLEIDNICRYRPMFMAGDDKPSHDAVRNWVKGFWRSMALAPESWLALAEDERTQVLIGPFVGFIDVSDRGPFDWREDADEFLDADAEEIPRILLVLRKLGQIRASRPSAGRPHRSTKIGRNDPCHCGSGRKYKRCCGAN